MKLKNITDCLEEVVRTLRKDHMKIDSSLLECEELEHIIPMLEKMDYEITKCENLIYELKQEVKNECKHKESISSKLEA
jgi:hypothetical protein